LISRLILKPFRMCVGVRRMTGDSDMTRARQDRLACLAHRALSTSPEDCARVERTLRLACRMLQVEPETV
jgi:hypothetical protein